MTGSDDTECEKEQAFGMVFALLSITVGNFSGRTSLAVIGGVVGFSWYVGATHYLCAGGDG